MITGAQLYTIRNYIQNERDFARSMEKIAKIGYTTVQISALGSGIRPEAVRHYCDENGLKIVLTHTNPDRILNETDAVIEEHEILGCEHIGIGMMPDRYRSREWISYFADDYLEPAKKIKAAGKRLMYHNHHIEFEKYEGTYVMDLLTERFAPDELGVTLDTYWVQAAGGDVCDWISRLGDRIPCVHLKDLAVVNHQSVMAPVGEGNLNFPKILNALEQTCCKYILVEQDECQGSPFDCLETSLRNLKQMGY